MKRQKKFPKLPVALLSLLCLCVLVFLFLVVKNHLGANLERLQEDDQAVLAEYNTLCASLETTPLWEDYPLQDMPILAMAGTWGDSYLINPAEPVSSIFAQKIALPEDWTISVYRITAAAPGLMQFRFDGDFNTIGKTYSLFGNTLYYVKYDRKSSVTEPWTSHHFVTFLTHEAFHYYRQENWSGGGRFSADDLTEGDISLLEEEYQALGQIQTQLISQNPDREVLETAARTYLAVMDRRLEANPEYLRRELEMETAEGTATYVAIEASRRVGYDFGVMYFTNQKDVPFAEVVPQYQAGHLDKSFLADRMPYETGAILCQLMDALGLPDWQKALNEQTPEAPVSLYDVLKNWAES